MAISFVSWKAVRSKPFWEKVLLELTDCRRRMNRSLSLDEKITLMEDVNGLAARSELTRETLLLDVGRLVRAPEEKATPPEADRMLTDRTRTETEGRVTDG